MLIAGVIAYIQAQSSITSIVGERIQPVPGPEDLADYPCITYQSPSYIPEYANDGPIGVSMTRIVFDCQAQRYLDARTLAETLANLFSGYEGALPNGTKVYLATIANLVDGFSDASRLYKSTVHVLFQFAE